RRPSLQRVRDEWLPQWLASAPVDQTLHALSVGSATGEEAWTLAWLFDAAFAPVVPLRRFGITATDVSQPALAVARQARYPIARLQEIPQVYHQSNIEASGDADFLVVERLRKRVGFACVNLPHATRAPLRQLDLIYCQNVLIYFARERRGELLDGLARLLRPNGLLVLGPGEVTGWSHPQLRRTGGRQTLACGPTSKETQA